MEIIKPGYVRVAHPKTTLPVKIPYRLRWLFLVIVFKRTMSRPTRVAAIAAVLRFVGSLKKYVQAGHIHGCCC